MRKGTFICLIGIDGSGKTTLATALRARLAARGVQVDYVQCKYDSVLMKASVGAAKWALSMRGKNMRNFSERYQTKKALFQSGFLRWAYRLIIRISYIPQILFKVRLPLMQGRSIVCDRYIYDTVVDLAVDTQMLPDQMHRTALGFLRLAPEPDLLLVLDVDGVTALQRNLAKRDGLTLQYINERRKTYLDLAKRLNAVIMDSSRNPDELQRQVWERIGPYIIGGVAS